MRKFEYIAQDIKNKITTKKYKAGQLLPSENQLSDQYQASRETIRRALNILAEQGYIHKQKGYGSIILDIHPNMLPVSGLVSFHELQKQQGTQTTTEVLINKEIKAPDFICKQVDTVQPDTPMIHLVRTRSHDEKVLIVDEDYLLKEIVDTVPTSKAEHSLYDYLENDLNLEIGYALKEFRAQHPNHYCKQAMNLTDNDYVMDVMSYVYLKDNQFFQYTVSHHDLETFTFHEFARRRNHLY